MMKLQKIQGEFETVELAELAAGRIRRSVRGVQRTAVHRIGRSVDPMMGRERYTILPANMRMNNYATATMISDISDDVLPEPMYRRSAELLILCDAATAGKAAAIMQALGAVKIKNK